MSVLNHSTVVRPEHSTGSLRYEAKVSMIKNAVESPHNMTRRWLNCSCPFGPALLGAQAYVSMMRDFPKRSGTRFIHVSKDKAVVCFRWWAAMTSSSRIEATEERLAYTIQSWVLPCSSAPGRTGGGYTKAGFVG